MSWPQPTAQYGHTPRTTLASLILKDVARTKQGVTTRDVTARLVMSSDSNTSALLVHTDNREANVLQPVGKALRHCENPLLASVVQKCPSGGNTTSGLTKLSRLPRCQVPPYICACLGGGPNRRCREPDCTG